MQTPQKKRGLIDYLIEFNYDDEKLNGNSVCEQKTRFQKEFKIVWPKCFFRNFGYRYKKPKQI